MTILWTHDDAAQATGGRATGHWNAARVEIDSRKIQPGDLYVALIGERVDGHRFVAEALQKGAVAAIVSRIPDNVPTHAPLVIVADTHKALEALARFARARSNAKIVGVTGSVGKTSTREMIRLALAAHGETYATHGNYNNHIGTPLMLANLPPDATFAVFEMGMNHPGEIAPLSRMVQPHVAVITNVEEVHLEFFSGIEGIADAKAEIFAGLAADGIALLNADNAMFARLQQAASDKKLCIESVGEAASATHRLLRYRGSEKGAELELMIAGAPVHCALAATGRHWSYAALFALAAAQAFGLDVQQSARALSAFCEVDGRGGVTMLRERIMLVDDSYNASPASMRAAFAKLMEMRCDGRKIVVLGDMLELGEGAPAMHAALAPDIIRAGISAVFSAGSLMAHLFESLPPNLRREHAAQALDLLPALEQQLEPGDLLLVKGSHGSHMYQLAQRLKESLRAL